MPWKEFVVQFHASKRTSGDRASCSPRYFRASLSSPNWRVIGSIIRRDLIEKNCRANALSAAHFFFFFIEALNIVGRDQLALAHQPAEE
jgi:hypothetical protein